MLIRGADTPCYVSLWEVLDRVKNKACKGTKATEESATALSYWQDPKLSTEKQADMNFCLLPTIGSCQ